MGIILSVIGFLLSVCAAAFVAFKVENGSDSPLYYLFILICIATLIYICITIIKYMKNGNEPRDTKKEEKRESEESKERKDEPAESDIRADTLLHRDSEGDFLVFACFDKTKYGCRYHVDFFIEIYEYGYLLVYEEKPYGAEKSSAFHFKSFPVGSFYEEDENKVEKELYLLLASIDFTTCDSLIIETTWVQDLIALDREKAIIKNKAYLSKTQNGTEKLCLLSSFILDGHTSRHIIIEAFAYVQTDGYRLTWNLTEYPRTQHKEEMLPIGFFANQTEEELIMYLCKFAWGPQGNDVFHDNLKKLKRLDQKRLEKNQKPAVKKTGGSKLLVQKEDGFSPICNCPAKCLLRKMNDDTFEIECGTYASGLEPGFGTRERVSKEFVMHHTFPQFCKEYYYLGMCLDGTVGCGTMQDLWETMVADLTRESAQALASALSQHVNGENGQ